MDRRSRFQLHPIFQSIRKRFKELPLGTRRIHKHSQAFIFIGLALIAISLIGGHLFYERMTREAAASARLAYLPRIELINKILARMGYVEVLDAQILDLLKKSSSFGPLILGNFWISENHLWVRVDQSNDWQEFQIYSQVPLDFLFKQKRSGTLKLDRNNEAFPKKWIALGDDWNSAAHLLNLISDSPPFVVPERPKNRPKKKSMYLDPREIRY